MGDARNHLLPDEAALVEIEARELVHVGLVRESIAVDKIDAAARNAEHDAMHFIFGGFDQLGAEIDCRPGGEMWRQHAAHAQLRQAGVRIAHPIAAVPGNRGRERASEGWGMRGRVGAGDAVVPDRHDAKRLRQILDDHLGAQLVEVEPFDQRRSERARAIEKKAAAVGRLRFPHDEIDDDLALRREQRAKSGLRRRRLRDVGGHEPVEEFAGNVAGDFDNAAVGKKR